MARSLSIGAFVCVLGATSGLSWAGPRVVHCDDLIWIGLAPDKGVLTGGGVLPGVTPAVSDAGVVFLGGVPTEMMLARAGGVDAFSVAYQGSSGRVVRTNSQPGSLGLPMTMIDGGLSAVSFFGSDANVRVDLGYQLPDFSPLGGVVIITTKVTNISGSPLSNVQIGRSMNPNFQAGATFGVDSQSMLLALPGAGIASIAGAGSILLGTKDPGLASIEGNLLSDPLDVLGSVRDPLGATEDTALNIARDLGTLMPNQSVTTTMYLITAANTTNALDVFNSVPSPVTAVPLLALAACARRRR